MTTPDFGSREMNNAVERFQEKNKRDPSFEESSIMALMCLIKMLESIDSRMDTANDILRDIRSKD